MPLRRISSGLCLLWLGLLCLALAAGCSSLKRSDTARTGREQLLLSNAIDQSLSKVDFEPFRGKSVLIEEKYLDCTDKGYVTASIRHRVARAGAHLVAKPEDADVILEMRSGGVGTDVAESFLGTPAIGMPGMMSIPEVKLVSRSNQTAIAKIALAAYDARSMELLGEGGISLSQSTDNNWHFLGVGPFQEGTVRREVEKGVPARSGQTYHELPLQVAFDQPSRPQRVQLTHDEQPAEDPARR